MAITEDWNSREIHNTHEATTLIRIFTMTTSDWESGGDGTITLPVVGQALDADHEDIRVTDIKCAWLNNTDCRATYTYSTRGFFNKSKRADKITSNVDSFNFTLGSDSGENFKNFLGIEKQWSVLWTASGGDRTPENAPPLLKYTPQIVWTQRMYLSTWDFGLIADRVGTINSAPFLKEYLNEQISRRGGSIIYISGDTWKWLFAGFESTEVGYNRHEISMSFVFNDDGWNTPYGVTTNMYATYDFNLLPKPNDENSSWDLSLRTTP